MRIGNGFIDRIYQAEVFHKIEMKGHIQDIQFGGRLTKGDTFLIGEGDTEKFYLTKYHDGAIELWERRHIRNSSQEHTIVTINRYEADCIYRLVDLIYEVIFTDYEPDEETEEDEEEADTSDGMPQFLRWTHDRKREFVRLRLIDKMKLTDISKKMDLRITQIKGIQKYYRSGKMKDVVDEVLGQNSSLSR